MKREIIPFNRPFMSLKAIAYMREAYENGRLSGDGPFTKRCQNWLEDKIGCVKALLTHSGTAALEMAAMLIDTQPGDEIIMPSFTFASTANAFVLRGGVPVFVDIRPDTLNIDEAKIETAITSKTRAIVVVHYAGVGCEMDRILAIAKPRRLWVIEDAAHATLSTYKNKLLGGFGHMAALSFHETKTLISGEGGALLINEPSFVERAEIIREKGTNRSQFFRGEVDKYTWLDKGSSYLPSDLIAAFLWSQFEEAERIIKSRNAVWERYHKAFSDLEQAGLLKRPFVPSNCRHNAHMYYLLLSGLEQRMAFLAAFKKINIMAAFHYVPLHDSPAGRRFGRAHGSLNVTRSISERLVRLPLWVGIEDSADTVIEATQEYILSKDKLC